MFNNTNERTQRAATLIELLHSATLIHDDVVDDADYRRSWFSIKALWKNKISVLVGDYVLSRGMLLALENKDYDLLEIVSRAVKEMSEGELLQLEKSRMLNLDEKVYEDIIKQKTACLIAACCAVGALSAGASNQDADRMWVIGENVGMAFQIKDDILDFTSVKSGKIKGGDIKEQKLSLPFIYAIKNSGVIEKRRLINIVKNKKKSDKNISYLIDTVVEGGGLDFAVEKMNTYVSNAQKLLNDFPESESKTYLSSLINFVIKRQH
jgi:octaprenyl-diphosphate synthase